MRFRRSLRVFLLAVLLCAVGVAVQQALTPPPDLAHLATRAPLQSALGPPTRLISTGESPFAVSPDGRLFRTDIPGKRMVAFGGPGNFVSPDGRWVLVPLIERAVATDGSRTLDMTRGYQDECLWLPDSRHWVTLDSHGGGLTALVQGLEQSRAVRAVPLGSPDGITRGWGNVGADLLGMVGPDRILAQTTPMRAEDGFSWEWARRLLGLPARHGRAWMRFFEFSVGGPGAPAVRQYTVPLPASVTRASAALSRQGRLAWLLFHTTGEYDQHLRYVDLTVSHPDGAQMRTIGRLVMDPASYKAQDESQWPDKLTWLPDGAHVRFVFKDMLWTIPIR